MKQPRYKTNGDFTRRPLIVIGAIAGVLVLVVVLISRSSDDPVAQDLVPLINISQTGATGVTSTPGETVIDSTGDEIPASEGAIDGKGVEPTPPEAPTATSDTPHGDEVSAGPADQATDVGPYVDTAARFTQLSVNRSTDAAAAAGLDKKLVQLSTGSLAEDLDSGTGDIQTAQVASTGSVIKAIPLTKKGDYAEVLVVTKQIVVDAATGQNLDPKYLNYLVRLEKVPGGDFAVTSWEPQL